MPDLREVVLDVANQEDGTEVRLRVALLPTVDAEEPIARLLDLRGVAARDEALEPVQLLEGAEYRYEFLGKLVARGMSTDRPEVLEPDDDTGRTGRLRPGLYTGSMRIKVFRDAREIGIAAFEVRSRKLDYLTDYRRMLSDVAEVATEAVMERFAASEQTFTPAETGDPLTLYQRFAFLQSLLSHDAFQAALHRILNRPYEEWKTTEELRSSGQGVRSGSQLSRQLSSPGRRLHWPESPLGIDVPAAIRRTRTEATLDNVPNRFVKFALTGWREVVQRLYDAMSRLAPSAAVSRGLRESQALLDSLDALLGEELFREVGDLRVFPSGNQALQKREGYRDIFRAYVQFEVAAQLSWRGGEDVYEAGQRDVATLYEYWAYIKLAQIIARVCDSPFDFSSLLSPGRDGISLELRRGAQSSLTCGASRLGRQLKMTTWYNRRFGKSIVGREGSWTTGMQPDISIKVEVNTSNLELYEPVWIHFDAKYRLEKIGEVFEGPVLNHSQTGKPPEQDEYEAPTAGPKRDDLNKMHAYRDAIRSSAGAYILYPGDEKRRPYRAFHEILPGLGAFPLHPSVSGDADGVGEIQAFLNDILDHVADQASQHERARWWQERVYGSKGSQLGLPAVPFLTKPPADARVLVGFVKSEEHLAWIHQSGYYNLRADERRGSVQRALLDSDLLLLWGDGLGERVELWRIAGTVEAFSGTDLQALDYPEPGGKRYYCLRLMDLIPSTAYAGRDRWWIEGVLAETNPTANYGAPASLAWSQVQHTPPG